MKTKTKVEHLKNRSVAEAIEVVRAAKDSAGETLSSADYKSFLGELLADAEGWRMELEDAESEEA